MRAGEWGGYGGGDAPGLKFETAEWIHRKEIAAICADTWGCEVRPNKSEAGIFQPWHWVVIPMMGITMGEIFWMEDLAADCAKDGVYEFFFNAPPLPITGAVGSPINPQAIQWSPTMAKNRKVIVTCAISGAIHTPTMSEHLPITPDEIAAQAIAAAEAGASILHLNARDPKDGRPSPDPEIFLRFLPRIKQATEVVCNVTTGGGHGVSVQQRLEAALRLSRK